MTRFPDFFIAGAPKSGTTALYSYLRTHPQVFLPRQKEPHYFARDFDRYRPVRSPKRYARLFKDALPHHRAIGEASAFYLLSRAAVPEIMRVIPHARLIVMLRNPIDMVHSLHSQFVYGFREDERSFPRAWAVQEQRRAGLRLPPHCIEPAHLQYGEVGRIGAQVLRLLDSAPRERVQLVLFDDFVRDTRAVYQRTLAFLGLDDDGRSEFGAVNESRIHRSEPLSRFLMVPPFPLGALKRGIKSIFGLERTRLAEAIYARNRVPVPRAPMDAVTRQAVAEWFRPDIELLASILNRPLGHWYLPAVEPSAVPGVACSAA